MGSLKCHLLSYLDKFYRVASVKKENDLEISEMIEHQFRRSFGEIVATLVRRIGINRISLAEDSAQEALVSALRTWPYSGVPDNPAGWLYRVAHNRALDTLRAAGERLKHGDSADVLQNLETMSDDQVNSLRFAKEIEDDRLRLMFTCCHPSLSVRSQIALTLRLVSGLSASEIAAALLSKKTAIQQQIVRAKKTLRSSDIPFEVPPTDELEDRLGAILKILYLVFNGGYAAPEGDTAIREDLCVEALRLTEDLLLSFTTAQSAVHALIALICAQLARFPARLDDEGKPVPLPKQDRALWNDMLIGKALRHHKDSIVGDRISPYHFEAAIAIEHCIAKSYEKTNWRNILENYDGLLALTGSPVVALNRIVALSKVHNAEIAMAELNRLEQENSLTDYYLLPAVRAALLEDMGKTEEAKSEYQRSRDLCRNSVFAGWLDAQLGENESE